MILRDQYFLTCDKSLQTFLKEKGKLSLKEMTTANDYYEAHGFPNGNQDKRSNGNGNKPYTHGKPNDGQPHGPSNVPLRCENCGLRNHRTSECKKSRCDRGNTNNMVCFLCNRMGHKRNQCPILKTNEPHKAAAMQKCQDHHTSECRKPKGDQGNTSSMVCFQCNRVGHKRSECPMLRTHGPYKTAAKQQMAYEPSDRKFSPHQCNDSRGEGEIKLACGCVMPVVAGALSPDGQVKLKEWRSQMTPCCKGRVNDTTTLVLTQDLQPVWLNHH